jgi:hypothetical protein
MFRTDTLGLKRDRMVILPFEQTGKFGIPKSPCVRRKLGEYSIANRKHPVRGNGRSPNGLLKTIGT